MVAKTDAGRRAAFKEVARKIVVKDREARKYGWSQNTIGEIERALARAYADGQQVGPGKRPTEGPPTFVDWIEIPPRGRDALWTMSVSISGHDHNGTGFSVELTKKGDGARSRWHRVEKSDTEISFSNGAVMPLVRLGLFGYSADDRSAMRMTDLGVATCLEFWRRWNSGDNTLPVMSMRP